MSCAGGCGCNNCNPVPYFTRLTPEQMGHTLGRCLIPVADKLRDLLTRFGLRPYQVSIVRTRWSGARRGLGVQMVESEKLIEPTPLIQDLSSMTEILNPVGIDEVGTILVTEISGRYTDDMLRGLDADGAPVDQNESLFYEVTFLQTGSKPAEKRRFVLRSAPMYMPTGFQWQIRLERSHDDRTRDGFAR